MNQKELSNQIEFININNNWLRQEVQKAYQERAGARTKSQVDQANLKLAELRNRNLRDLRDITRVLED